MPKKKNKTIIWVLLLIVVVMSVIKLTYKPSAEDLAPKFTPTNTPIPTEVLDQGARPTVRSERNYDDYPLWEKLPYSGVGFTVDHYTKPLTLVVRAKGLDRTLVKKDVEKWIGENGVDPASHTLVITN